MSNAYYVVTYTVAGTTNRVVFETLPEAQEFVDTGLWWAKDNGATITEMKRPEDSELTSADRNEVLITVFNNDNDKSDVYTIEVDKDGYMVEQCDVQTLDEDLEVINQFELPTPQWVYDTYEEEVTRIIGR